MKKEQNEVYDLMKEYRSQSQVRSEDQTDRTISANSEACAALCCHECCACCRSY